MTANPLNDARERSASTVAALYRRHPEMLDKRLTPARRPGSPLGAPESNSSEQACCLPGRTLASGDDRHFGFTLIEVLVTLVLLGIVAAIVLGSLRQVLEARGRLRPYLDQSQQTTLVASWFRQTVRALIADYESGKHRFAATSTEFSGLTASPLVGPPGTPTPFHWSLKYDSGSDLTVLEYQEDHSQAIQVATWAGHTGEFAYFGQDQEWHSAWPPNAFDPSFELSKVLPQLPQLIRLGGISRDLFPTVVAAPRGSSVPRQLPPSLFNG